MDHRYIMVGGLGNQQNGILRRTRIGGGGGANTNTNDDVGSFELLTCGTKDEEFPGVFQAIVVAVEDGWCGGEEPRQVSE